MARITAEGQTFEVPDDTRLVLALEDNGIDILHQCGGNARCTTCRVEFVEGEPLTMTQAERDRLELRDLLGQVRLSCQILCDHDMAVRPVFRVSRGDGDAGDRPKEHITPEPEWIERPY